MLKLIVLTLLLYPIMYALEVVTLALVLVVSLSSSSSSSSSTCGSVPLPWSDYYTKLLLMSYASSSSRAMPTARRT